MLTLFKLVQSLKPVNTVTLLDNVMLVRPVQLRKESDPILVTLLGIVTLVKLVQFSNAPVSMIVTLFGIEILVKWVKS